MIYGYARTSTTDQDNSLETQIEALKAAGCATVRSEQVSGASIEGRRELQVLLEFLREGDVLLVTRLDRLARNTLDMLTIVEKLGAKGVGVRSLGETWLDTSSSHGRLFLTMVAGIAQWERERIKERQREGIDKAKAEGRYKGSTPKIDRSAVWAMLDEGIAKAEIARRIECSEMSVYRIIKEGRLEYATAQVRPAP